jgi:hypothetical protein
MWCLSSMTRRKMLLLATQAHTLQLCCCQTFHCTPPEYEIKGWWCHGCFTEQKGERVPFEGAQVRWCSLHEGGLRCTPAFLMPVAQAASMLARS